MKRADHSYKNLGTILMYYGIPHEDFWHIDYAIRTQEYDGKWYFWDIRKKAIWYQGAFDDNGIMLFSGEDGNEHYSVINLAQFALGSYEEYLATQSLKWKDNFIKHADWLVDNQTTFNECDGVWINHYPVKLFKITKDWVSALGQAFAVSALTRAYRETEDQKYLDAARRGVIPYTIPRESGGVLVEHSGMKCLDEYTTENPSCVLNGYISAIWSIYDLALIDKTYDILFKEHVSNLADNLAKWDAGYWSWYDLWNEHDFIASYFYHHLHIKQLQIMYALTGRKCFITYAKKWASCEKNVLYCTKALLKKLSVRLR